MTRPTSSRRSTSPNETGGDEPDRPKRGSWRRTRRPPSNALPTGDSNPDAPESGDAPTDRRGDDEATAREASSSRVHTRTHPGTGTPAPAPAAPTANRPANPDTTPRRTTGRAPTPGTGNPRDTGRGAVVYINDFSKLFAKAPLSGHVARKSAFYAMKGGVHSGDISEVYPAQTPLSGGVQSGDFRGGRPPIPPPQGERDRLANADPKGPYLTFNKELTRALLEWAPRLENVPGHRALTQYILRSTNMNSGRLDGLVIPWKQVARCYGDSPETLMTRRSYRAIDLLEWYRLDVDPELEVATPQHESARARVITNTGIPDRIWDLAQEGDNGSFEGRVYLIDMKTARRPNRVAKRKQRKRRIEQQTPIIDPPEPLRRIQEYLNTLPRRIFSNRSWGLRSRIPEAKEAVREMAWQSEDAKRGELRKLVRMEDYPQPLYHVCDRFARTKCDAWNELMSVASKIRPHLYSSRDIELDLSKAHLGSYAPIAEDLGFDVPVLRQHLEASLEGEIDLWTNLANEFDAEVMPDEEARRSAAKRLYSLVYGSQINNARWRIIERYAEQTGEWVTGDAVDSVFEHDLVQEILDVRGKIRDVVEERRGLEDAFGRFISVGHWDKNEWRGVLSYVNSSFELSLIWECFREALKEEEWASEKTSRRPRFRIWLVQGDGFTIRVDRKRKPEPSVERLQRAVKEKANELKIPTALEVERWG